MDYSDFELGQKKTHEVTRCKAVILPQLSNLHFCYSTEQFLILCTYANNYRNAQFCFFTF